MFLFLEVQIFNIIHPEEEQEEKVETDQRGRKFTQIQQQKKIAGKSKIKIY